MPAGARGGGIPHSIPPGFAQSAAPFEAIEGAAQEAERVGERQPEMRGVPDRPDRRSCWGAGHRSTVPGRDGE